MMTATETHELVVGAAPRLEVRNPAGNVTVRAGADGQVRIEVTKRVRGGILATPTEDDLEQMRVEVSQAGDTVRVRAEYPKFGTSKQYSVDLEITLPARADLELRLNAGNLRVERISGRCAIEVNAGSLDAHGVTFGDESELSLNAGNLTFDGALAPGGSLLARVNAGNARLTLPRAANTHLDARTQAGSVKISGWSINTVRTFASQSAEGALGEASGGRLSVRVDAGNIAVSAR